MLQFKKGFLACNYACDIGNDRYRSLRTVSYEAVIVTKSYCQRETDPGLETAVGWRFNAPFNAVKDLSRLKREGRCPLG